MYNLLYIKLKILEITVFDVGGSEATWSRPHIVATSHKNGNALLKKLLGNIEVLKCQHF